MLRLTPESQRVSQARLPAWVWALAASCLAGIVLSVEAANLSVWAPHPPPPLTSIILNQFRAWLLWALLAPLIYRVLVHFPIAGEHTKRDLLVHATGSLLSAALHALVSALATGRALPRLSMIWSVVTYWDILGVSYAVDAYRRLQARAFHTAVLEKQLAQAQLLALKMQLQPHFLFNALNSIASLLRSDLVGAERMLACLGDFLRMTLEGADHQQVPLRQELQLLRSYLEIEQIRFRDRLSVRFDVEPAVLDDAVPNLILQPILENAIRHGIARKTSPGCVEIRASHQNGHLALQVQDDGPGFRGQPADGNGLSITRARLRESYGDASVVELTSPISGGTLVTLRIPSATQS
jgi:two-component system LytT family sensor kinase